MACCKAIDKLWLLNVQFSNELLGGRSKKVRLHVDCALFMREICMQV